MTIRINLLNRNLFKDSKKTKSDEGKKSAADLAIYSSIDTYITKTEKESKLRKTGIFSQSIRKMFMIKVDFEFTVKNHQKTTVKELFYARSNKLSSFYLAFSYS